MTNVALDPQAAAILEMFSGLPEFDFNTLTIDEYRMFMEQPSPFAPGDEIASREVIEVAGGAGMRPAAVYTPMNRPADAPVIVFFHGGGFVAGKLEQHDNICRVLAARVNAVVVSVDYRLAPEHPFPAGVDDGWAALQWVIKHAERHGWDASRVAVAGDSAGGNIAAVLAQTACANNITLRHQLLIYPVTDLARESDSYTANGAGYFLTLPMMRWFKKLYLGNNAGFAKDVRLSPLHAEVKPGLAPATVVVAGFDPLRDEGIAYGELLKQSNVPCEIHLFAGQIHGFVSMLGMIDQAEEALATAAAALKKSFE